MIRTLIVPDNQDVLIQIPASFVGKQVEVIAFTIDDSIEDPGTKDMLFTHYASENILEKDWLNPEEDEAWVNL